MKRLPGFVVTLGLYLVVTLGVLGLLVVLLAVLVPDTVTDLHLGSQVLGTTVRNQAGTLVDSARLNPLLDVAIAIGAYIFVCLISWSQDRLSNYLANRSHFS
jgi:hypothetical protein